MGLTRTAFSAVNLLIDVGYFPVHVNLDLLKLNVPTVHSDDIISAAESILSESTDIDEVCWTVPFVPLPLKSIVLFWLLL